jgi:lipopolysaccharide export system protein LptA
MSTLRFLRGLWPLTALVLVAAVGVGQQVRRGNVATIQAEQLEYDWETGDTKMTGNCRVDIKGDYDATMTTPALTFKTDIEKAQVLSFEASGPVNFDILTRPSNGKRSRILARCSDSATFSEQTMLVVMQGDAHAEITSLPRTETLQSAVYDGDSMTIDLKNHKVKLSQAHLKVEMAPTTGGGAEGTE